MRDYEYLDNNGNYIDYFVILEDNKKMLKELDEKDKEIERLNNIIDELEKLFEEEIKEERPKDHLWLMGYYDASKDYLKRLKELKENKDIELDMLKALNTDLDDDVEMG